MNRGFLSIGLWLALAACSSAETDHQGTAGASVGGSAGSSGRAGISGASGESGSPGTGGSGTAGANAAGANAAGANAAGASTGGTSAGNGGSGGKVEPGNPCVSDCPTGKVTACYGPGCPFGKCDDGGFYASRACDTVYPAPASTSTVYCAANQSIGYCLETTSNNLSFWAISCTNGTPKVTYCPDSCGVTDLGVSGC